MFVVEKVMAENLDEASRAVVTEPSLTNHRRYVGLRVFRCLNAALPRNVSSSNVRGLTTGCDAMSRSLSSWHRSTLPSSRCPNLISARAQVRKQPFTRSLVHCDEIDITRLSGIAFASKEPDREFADDNISSRAHRTKKRN